MTTDKMVRTQVMLLPREKAAPLLRIRWSWIHWPMKGLATPGSRVSSAQILLA